MVETTKKQDKATLGPLEQALCVAIFGADQSTLSRMLQSKDSFIIAAAAMSGKLDSQVVEILSYCDRAIVRGACVRSGQLSYKRLHDIAMTDDSVGVVMTVIHSEKLFPDDIFELSYHKSARVRQATVLFGLLPDSRIYDMSEDRNPYVRSATIESDRLPTERIMAMRRDAEPAVRAAAVRSGYLTDQQLTDMERDGCNSVKAAVYRERDRRFRRLHDHD